MAVENLEMHVTRHHCELKRTDNRIDLKSKERFQVV